MHSVVALFRPWPRAIALAAIAVSAAGCSSETTRFNDGSNRNPGEVTGSISPGPAAPVSRVDSRPLPQTSQAPVQQQYAVRTAPVSSPVTSGGGIGGSTGGGHGIASYSPSSTPAYGQSYANQSYNQPAPVYNPQPTPVTYTPQTTSPDYTGSTVAPNSVVRKQGHWTWDGGTAITVIPGETVDSIARRHGVPATAIIEANNLASANSIQVGQRLVIPRYVQGETAAVTPPQPSHTTALATPKPAPVTTTPALASVSSRPAAAPASSGVHVVAPGDTLTKIAHQYGKSIAEITKANQLSPSSRLTVGDRIIIPGMHAGSVKAEAQPLTVAQAKAPTVVATKEVVTAGPVQSASVVTPAAENPVAESSAKGQSDVPGFRWPVRGRITAGFGPRPNGQQNDGIDVAVPENTPIKSAEDGVVAYAGNELKGYGNLVLVRHPNGYVTAYAHAKELMVKRGDQVKRGQIIGKSGQTGNVDVPELHFEVRKGSTPVDPMQFLNGA